MIGNKDKNSNDDVQFRAPYLIQMDVILHAMNTEPITKSEYIEWNKRYILLTELCSYIIFCIEHCGFMDSRFYWARNEYQDYKQYMDLIKQKLKLKKKKKSSKFILPLEWVDFEENEDEEQKSTKYVCCKFTKKEYFEFLNMSRYCKVKRRKMVKRY